MENNKFYEKPKKATKMIKKYSLGKNFSRVLLLFLVSLTIFHSASANLKPQNVKTYQVKPIELFIILEDLTPQSKVVNIMLDTNVIPIGYVKIIASFDPKLILLDDEITVSQNFGTVVSKISKDDANATGKIAITLAITTNGSPQSGRFSIAQFPIRSNVDDFTNQNIFIFSKNEIQMVDISAQQQPFIVFTNHLFIPIINR